MITPLTNGLLVNPVPLQLTLNLCSHGCMYCTTPDTLITLSNLTVKPIGEIKKGDNILGWAGDARFHNPSGKYGFEESLYRKWTEAEVTQVNKRTAEVFEVTLMDDSVVRCTGDHQWFTGRFGKYEYQSLIGVSGKPMSQLKQIKIRKFKILDETPDFMLGYIRGFCEGDATWMPQRTWRIAAKDPEPIVRISDYLQKLGFNKPEIKPYSGGLQQIYFSPNAEENNLINGLDVESTEYWRGWLSGIYDAEGNTPARLGRSSKEALSIAQYKSQNVLTYNRIERVLRLFGFGFVCDNQKIRIIGGSLEEVRLIQLIQPSIKRKSNPLMGSTHKGVVGNVKIKSVVSIGVQEVISLSTSTGNYIAGGFLSSNCFSILNNPKRKADLKGIVSQLKNHKTRNDLISYFLREKYPVLISNNVDPFSKNNYQLTSQIVDILNSYEIPIQLNTRGGYGWQEVTDKMKPSLIYVSVPYFDDEVRMKYEPNAPSLQDRFDMVKELVKRHKVMIGINPFDKAFCDDHKQIIDQYRAIGIKYFWINAFHLTYKQQANLTENQKEILGEELLNHAARKNLFTPEWIENYIEVREYCKTVDCEIIGDPSGHFAGFEEDLYSVYDKLLPTQNDFFKWCEENKTDGDFIYFQEFFHFFNTRLPQIEVNISPFIENKSNLGDQTFYKKTKLSNILHVYWDSKAGLKLPTYYPVFSWVKKQFPTKLDWIKDEHGDRVMLYHPNNYNKKEFQILD